MTKAPADEIGLEFITLDGAGNPFLRRFKGMKQSTTHGGWHVPKVARLSEASTDACLGESGYICAPLLASESRATLAIMHRHFLCSLVIATSALSADWPQHLGPLRNGQADETEAALPDMFAGELKPIWEKNLGSGFAGPVVLGGKVIVFHREENELVIEKLDAKTGERAWRYAGFTDYRDSFGMNDGPRATPAIADGRVFVHGAEGMVVAVDYASGKELWKYDTVTELKSPQGYFGRAPSPLVVGELVIICTGGTRDGKAAGVIALDVKSGALRWQSVADEAGYSSPIKYGDPEKPRLLCWMRNELWSLDAATGQVRHHARLRADMDASVNSATPIPVGEGDFFLSAGYDVGAHTIALEPEDDPFDLSGLGDIFESHYSTPVFSDFHLYGFHDRQETGQKLRCIDLHEGKVKWDSPRVPGGTLIRVHDKLVCVTEQGELWIVKATPEKFEQLHVSQILRAGHRSNAAYSNGVLFARDGEKLVAVKLR